MSRSYNGTATYFFYDGEKPISEVCPNNGNNNATNVYGLGIDEIVLRFMPANAYFFYQDHEGSVTHVIDNSGGVTEQYRYDAFGQPTIKDGAGNARAGNLSGIGNRFLFTGREWAPGNLGFYEYRARAYHPGLGRFMSEDPKGFDAGDYNLYRYCANDPLDKTDPMGLQDVRFNDNNSYQPSIGAPGVSSGNNANQKVWDLVRKFVEKLRPDASGVEAKALVNAGYADAKKAGADAAKTVKPDFFKNNERKTNEQHYVEIVSADGKSLQRVGPSRGFERDGKPGADDPPTGGAAPITSSHDHGPQSGGPHHERHDFAAASGDNRYHSPRLSFVSSTKGK